MLFAINYHFPLTSSKLTDATKTVSVPENVVKVHENPQNMCERIRSERRKVKHKLRKRTKESGKQRVNILCVLVVL